MTYGLGGDRLARSPNMVLSLSLARSRVMVLSNYVARSAFLK